jgi:ABC-type phosphate transport system substrate-binding protein
VRNSADAQCYSPSLGDIEVQRYPAHRPLMLYAAAADLENATALGFLQSISTAQAAAPKLSVAGFTAASVSSYNRNLNNLDQNITGRSFSRPSLPIGISTAATGEFTLSGNGLAAPLLGALESGFTAQYPQANLQKALLGDTAAITALCEGSSDIALLASTPTEEQLAACTAADSELFQVPLASQALVVVVAAKNTDLPTCITGEALVNALAMPLPADPTQTAQQEGRDYNVGTVNWSELAAGYPDVPLFLFLPGRSSLEVDWIFAAAGAADRFGRSDREDNIFYPDTSYSDRQHRRRGPDDFKLVGLPS